MPVSINVDKTRKHFPEKFMARACFSNVRSFLYEKHCFQCQFLFPRYKLCLRYTAGKFNENPSMRALEKFLRARASEHSSNFCEQFEQRPNFASTFELDGTIRHPYIGLIPQLAYSMTISTTALNQTAQILPKLTFDI